MLKGGIVRSEQFEIVVEDDVVLKWEGTEKRGTLLYDTIRYSDRRMVFDCDWLDPCIEGKIQGTYWPGTGNSVFFFLRVYCFARCEKSNTLLY
jgi:hypothetical protein